MAAAADLGLGFRQAGTQLVQALAAEQGGEKQTVRLQALANLNQSSRKVVYPMEIQAREDEIEALRREGQKVCTCDRGGAFFSCLPGHALRQVALRQPIGARLTAQGLGHLTRSAGEIEHSGKLPPDVAQAIVEARGDFPMKEVVRVPLRCGALPVPAVCLAVENRCKVGHTGQYGRWARGGNVLLQDRDQRIDAVLAGAKAAGRLAVDLLLPPRCLACGDLVTEASSICAECWGSLDFITKPYCVSCGYPFEYEVGEAAVCAGCEASPPRFDRARAAMRYNEASKPLLLRFKHADKAELAPVLVRFMARAGGELLAGADLVAPVPLHRWRLLRRRYNQSALLAKQLAVEAGRPFLPDLLTRRRNTPPQGQLGREGRKRNVAGAFAVAPRHRDDVVGRRVLLVDDVMTSGATANACAAVLKRSGAEQVFLLTAARVVLA